MKTKIQKSIVFSMSALFLVLIVRLIQAKYLPDNATLLIPLSLSLLLFGFIFYGRKEPFSFLSFKKEAETPESSKAENASLFIAALVLAFILTFGFFETKMALVSVNFFLWLVFSLLGIFAFYKLTSIYDRRETKWFLLGIYLPLGIFIVSFLIAALFGKNVIAEINLSSFFLFLGNTLYFTLFIFLVSLVAMEGAFRGFVLKSLRKRLFFAAIFSSIAFALWNFLTITDFSIVHIITTVVLSFAMGGIFSFLFLRTKSILSGALSLGLTLALRGLLINSVAFGSGMINLEDFIKVNNVAFQISFAGLYLIVAAFLLFKIWKIEKKMQI